jgi:hypothetical protein
MRRLGNARTIMEIEALVAAGRAGPQDLHWLAHGVECSRSAHRYSGPAYALTIDVLNLRHRRPGRPWHLILVSELWRAGATDLRSIKWLKLVAGRPQDPLHWLAEHRDERPIPSRPKEPTP